MVSGRLEMCEGWVQELEPRSPTLSMWGNKVLSAHGRPASQGESSRMWSVTPPYF